jgi:hypothetical protein
LLLFSFEGIDADVDVDDDLEKKIHSTETSNGSIRYSIVREGDGMEIKWRDSEGVKRFCHYPDHRSLKDFTAFEVASQLLKKREIIVENDHLKMELESERRGSSLITSQCTVLGQIVIDKAKDIRKKDDIIRRLRIDADKWQAYQQTEIQRLRFNDYRPILDGNVHLLARILILKRNTWTLGQVETLIFRFSSKMWRLRKIATFQIIFDTYRAIENTRLREIIRKYEEEKYAAEREKLVKE